MPIVGNNVSKGVKNPFRQWGIKMLVSSGCLRLAQVFAVCFFLVGCGESYSWNQKYTVVIETPNGLKTGSSVVRQTYRYQSPSGGLFGNAHHTKISGEAVVIDLGAGKYLFLLTNRADMGDLPYKAIGPRYGYDYVAYREMTPKIVGHKGIVDISTQKLLLVTFADLDKPKTVKHVDLSDLSQVFGEGFSVKSITLEITDEAVTVGKVEAVLRWLKEIWPNRLDGRRYESIDAQDRFANSLSVNSFSTEISK